MTDDAIEKACPAAERVIISRDYYSITVGIKLGHFSQSVILPLSKDVNTQRAMLMDCYRGLKAMGRKLDYDAEAAQNARRGQ